MKLWPSYLQSITFTVNNTPCCPPPVLLTKDFFSIFQENQISLAGGEIGDLGTAGTSEESH